MGAKNARGVWVPAAGDGLLEGWATAAKQGGMYLPVASVAAARTALDLAAAAGMGATTSNPMLFLVGTGVQKVAYVSDGTKSNSVWVLAPLNEVEVDERTYTLGVTINVTAGQYSNMMTTQLPARPFDRVMVATANAYGAVTGNVDLCLQDGGSDISLSRWATGDAQSATVTNSGIIPANTAPSIRVGVRGGSPSGGKAVLSRDSKLNRLVVVAYPITMSE